MTPAILLRSFVLSTALGFLLTPAELVAQTKTIVGTGCHGMSLDADELPDVTTAPFNFVVSGIPAGSILNLLFFSWSSTGGPIDLGPIGAPGCPVYLAGPIFYGPAFPLGPTATASSLAPPIYNTCGWTGVYTIWQAVSFVPAINPAGLVTSNALELVGG